MSVQIFILSKLMKENTYPYKLKKQLSEPIPLDQLGGLTESKLYYHFDSLAKKGLIETVEIIKEENRPDKHVFSITAKGREELPKLIYSLFKNADDIKGMTVGLVNLKYVERDEVVNILKKRLEKVKGHWEEIKGIEAQLQVSKENEWFVDFMSSYISSQNESSIHWLEKLINTIKRDEN
ncbi:PadR family transcriptional regulator [Cytobacillus gottheilii]|uniref:PadR family transcriptional regulator n=1 Tax=Cytobacillus gottheilii TaxID=859144 RepID=UPI000831DD5C|nr:PadR family transcriptional regulator [Cytobacillus gottheilii]